MARRRSKSKSRSYKRKRTNEKGGLRWAAVGLAAVVGLVWLVKSQANAEPEGEVPLSTTPAANAKAGKEGATKSTARVPASLKKAFKQLNSASTGPLLDLRRIAVEYPDSPEASRAEQALREERTRHLAVAKKTKGVRALTAITRAYLATLDKDTRQEMREAAGALSVFGGSNRAAAKLMSIYTVQPGDRLGKIARKQRSSWRLIARLNGINPKRLRAGQKLRIPRGKVQVVIFKRDFELTVLQGGNYVKSYDCAIGKNDRTPEGWFTIGTKLINPDWYAPDGKVYRYGSKENILGTRWLAFEDTAEHRGFGIHGTKFPNSIGTAASMGCLRLRNPDAEEVYDLVPKGSRVRIVR